MKQQPLASQTKLLKPEGVDARLSTDTLAVTDPYVATAIRFIRESVRSPIQVADVAREAGISRRALERRFAEVVGHSPAHAIQESRLK